LLEGFLYEAIFVLEGFEGEIPRSGVQETGLGTSDVSDSGGTLHVFATWDL